MPPRCWRRWTPAPRSCAATTSARSSRSTWPSATARSCAPPCSATRRCSCSSPRRPSGSRPSTPRSRRRCARAGPRPGVEAWLGGRVDGPALERARTAYRAFFADYAGLASWPVTRRELRAMDLPAVVLTGPRSPAHVVAAADALAGLMPAARRADDGDLVGRCAHAARVTLSARRCVAGSVKARRLPVALLAVLLALRWLLPAGGSAAPAPTAACAAILAPRPAIELPVQVAPGLSVRVRDPYGGLIARNRLFVAFSVRYPNRGRPRPRRRGDMDARRRRPPPRRGRARPAPGAVDDVRGRPARRRRAHPAGRRRPGRRGRAPGDGDRLPARLPVPAARRQRRPGGGGRLRRPGSERDRAASGQRALRGAARRAPGHRRAVRRPHAGAAGVRAEPRRARPAHRRPAARHDSGPRAPRARASSRAGIAARCRRGFARPAARRRCAWSSAAEPSRRSAAAIERVRRRAAGARGPALLNRPGVQPPRSKK